MKAIVIGATGATGVDLVQALLQDTAYTSVSIFVRRETGLTHPKLLEVITDFDLPGNVSAYMSADILFICLGTTLKAAGSKEKQRYIDVEIPVAFATVAKKKGVQRIVLLSAYGASTNSNIFYSKLKGELEESLKALAFEQLIIFRPGLLLRKQTDRIGEKLAGGFLKFMNDLSLLKQYRPLPTALLADKMRKAPQLFPAGTHIVALQEIFSL